MQTTILLCDYCKAEAAEIILPAIAPDQSIYICLSCWNIEPNLPMVIEAELEAIPKGEDEQ